MDNERPGAFLDDYRGKTFKGEWPTIPELFSINVDRFPDRPCFTVFAPDKKTLTYRQANDHIRKVADYLRSIGIGKDSKVAVTGKNSPEWAIAYLAVLQAGAIVVPIDYQLTVAEAVNLIRASDTKALFVDEEKYQDLKTSCPQLLKVMTLYEGGPDYIYTLDAGTAALPPLIPAQEADLAAILFTSGTTGNPKGVMLTHKNFVSDCFLAQGNMTICPTDVFYALLPIHHSYTMLAVFIEAISVGAEIVFGKRLVVKQIMQELKEGKVTMFLAVPVLFNKFLDGIMKGIKAKGPVVYGLMSGLMGFSGSVKKTIGFNPGRTLFKTVREQANLSTIRICISGGGPLAPEVFRKYNELGIDFVQGYGLTETSPILTLNPTYHYKETSVGKVIPQADLKILDPNEDGIGEIIVKGPMVMAGYYKMEEETKAVFTEDGYFRTGDLGYLDDENYLYLTGRAKNMIVTSGGKNVYPEEIEDKFQLYSEIEQILVRGYYKESSTVSEEIEALIYPSQEWLGELSKNKDEAFTLAEQHMHKIVEEVNQKLLPYQKITRVIVLKEPLEMTTTQKVKRFVTPATGEK
ncbi:MAG TPA: AMP-binding protein [Spirochaetales bacterium]|nr:AMP-binding protein [Spirochaetales bacterium]